MAKTVVYIEYNTIFKGLSFSMENNGIINIPDINISRLMWAYEQYLTVPWKYTSRLDKWITDSPECKHVYSLRWHISGSHDFTVNNITTRVDCKNSLILENLSPDDYIVYHRKSFDLPQNYICINFATENPIPKELFTYNMIRVYPHKKQEKLLQMFQDAKALFPNKPAGWELKLKSIIYEALHILFETYYKEKQSNISPDMMKISRYIDKHLYDKNISMKELADSIYISNVHFSRLFSKTFGISPKKYITERKLESVAYMLTHTDIPINEICEQVRFNDMSYFNKLFKKKYKATPRDYRKNKEW